MKDDGYNCCGTHLSVVANMQKVYPWPTDSYIDEHVLVLPSSDNNQGDQSNG